MTTAIRNRHETRKRDAIARREARAEAKRPPPKENPGPCGVRRYSLTRDPVVRHGRALIIAGRR